MKTEQEKREKRVDDENSEQTKRTNEREKLQELVYLSLDRNSLGLLELDVGFLLLASNGRSVPSPLLDSSSAG